MELHPLMTRAAEVSIAVVQGIGPDRFALPTRARSTTSAPC
jgi:hypothetical protein